MKPVALIAGPTASGKSDLAVKLAHRLAREGRHGVIINADSQQVYRDLHILSARPTEDEMGGIEHRLFGTWDGAEPCSAANWADAAKAAIEEAHAAGSVPILCGGTGLYMRTLLDGISPIPAIDPHVREAVRELSTEALRARLNARCDLRFERMLDKGALAEVEALLARDLDPALPVMRAIGVPEIKALLEGDLSRAEAIAAGQLATRQYAKRQYTWFRNQLPQSWPRADNKTIADHDFFVSLFQ